MKARRYDLVMAVFPNARGFAYVVFEGPLSPVDWGMSDVRGNHRNKTSIQRFHGVLKRLTPDILIIRNSSDIMHGRGRRLCKLIEAFEELADQIGVPTVQFSRQEIRQGFGYLGSPTRVAIVETVAKHIPLFAPYVPPVRKIWKREDRRMGLFDAAALAWTFYRTLGKI